MLNYLMKIGRADSNLLRLSNKLPPIVSNAKPATRRRKSLTDPGPAGIGGRQIDVHVNVGPVEHCENPAACRQDFTDFGDAVFDRAGPRRYERVVGDVDLVERHVLRGRVNRLRSRCNVCVDDVNGPVQRLLPLIDHLVGLKP